VDGFELGLLPEWDSQGPPLTPTSAPADCEKHTVEEICEAVEHEGFRILTMHANRDVGAYLCSHALDMITKGERLADEASEAARQLGAKICIFHLWPSWKESSDVNHLLDVCAGLVGKQLENVLTVSKTWTPFSLAEKFRHITLDLKWASMYHEFERFARARRKTHESLEIEKHSSDS
jgi:acetolactate synthase regulatory subunit